MKMMITHESYRGTTYLRTKPPTAMGHITKNLRDLPPSLVTFWARNTGGISWRTFLFLGENAGQLFSS